MNLVTHHISQTRIAEVNDIHLPTAEGMINLLGDLYFQDFNGMIIYAEDLPNDFLDLSSGTAGEVLQKFSNYRMKLAIIGINTNEARKSLLEFIRESNKLGQIVFCENTSEALEKLG